MVLETVEIQGVTDLPFGEVQEESRGMAGMAEMPGTAETPETCGTTETAETCGTTETAGVCVMLGT